MGEAEILKVDAPQGRYTAQTDCGPLEISYPQSSRRVELPEHTRTAAERCQARLKSRYLMALLPKGTFEMGCAHKSDHCSTDKFLGIKTVFPFAIGVTEVTQGLWETVFKKTAPCDNAPCGPDYPLVDVSWFDAIEFANKLSDKEELEKCYRYDAELYQSI